MCLPMMRPAMSAPEPAVSGTIMRMGLVGYSCARARDAAADNIRTTVSLISAFIDSPWANARSAWSDQNEDLIRTGNGRFAVTDLTGLTRYCTSRSLNKAKPHSARLDHTAALK